MSIPEKRLLDTLIRFFGRDQVLTAVEHLYVYSHSGKFGVESKLLPLAVLKLNSDIEITHLEELLKDTDIQVIRNNEGSKEPDIQRPYILLDVQKPITITEFNKAAQVKFDFRSIAVKECSTSTLEFSQRI